MNNDNTNPIQNKETEINVPVTDTQKNQILSGKTILATLLGAGGAIGFVSAKDMNSEIEPIAEECIEEAVISIPEGINVASDEMTFGEAFQLQRELQGAGGLFKFNDNYYNTYYKEEWDSMSDLEKEDYFTSLDQTIEYNSSKFINDNGSETEISIDNDSFAEITLKDDNGDGILEIDQVDLNNDNSYDVIHGSRDETPEPVSVEESIADVVDMEAGSFDELEEIPEVDEFDWSSIEDEFSDFEEEGDVVDPSTVVEHDETEEAGDMVDPSFEASEEGDIVDPSTVVEADEMVELGDIEDPSFEASEEGDIVDPSTVVEFDEASEEGDLVDPSLAGIEEGDIVDPSTVVEYDEMIEEGDIAEPSLDSDAINDLPDLISDLDMSEFDF